MNFGQNTNAYQNQRFAGMRVPTSLYGKAISVIYGTQRIAWNLLWYGDFVSKPASSVQGGKGGLVGSAGKGNSYVYYSAIQAFLCAGPIVAFGNVWDSQGILLIQTGKQVVTVPGTGPFVVTVTPPGTGSFADDVGANRADAFSVTANDYGSPGPITYAGTQQTPMVQVPSSPGPGQYTFVKIVGPPASGQYTFNPADAGKTVEITYSWQDPSVLTGAKSDPGSLLNLTLFTGVQGQTPWGYLTTNHPSQALGYTLLAYVASPSIYLGATAELPAFTFEVIGKKVFGGGIVDSNPYDCFQDLLVDQNYGLLWTPADLDLGNIGGTWLNWSEYCVANGIFVSMQLTAQESAASIAGRILQITNAEMVCSGPVIKMVTYGDTTAVGNGVTFTPNTTPIVDLDDDDFITSTEPGESTTEDPVEMTIPTILDAYNDVFVEYVSRAGEYNPEVVEQKDESSISQIGVRTMPSVGIHDVTTQPIATLVASNILQRSVYIRAQYKFTLGSQYRYLEPMDMVTLTDEGLGLDLTPCRIVSIDEDEKWNLQIVAEEFPWGTATPTLYPKQKGGGGGNNASALPGDVNTPIILEANNRVTKQNGYQLWFAISGENIANWGGCHIHMSTDGVEYQRIFDINNVGEVPGPARTGELAAIFSAGPDPDVYLIATGNVTSAGGGTATITFSAPHSLNNGDIAFIESVTHSFPSFTGTVAVVNSLVVTVTYAGAAFTSGGPVNCYHVLAVDMTESNSILNSGTQADADNDVTLCAIINGSGAVELVSYEDAIQATQFAYQLHYIRRGQLTSSDVAHSIGEQFVRLDNAIFRYHFDPILIGQTVHFKFTSFNTANQMEQDISEVPDYTVVIAGSFNGVTDLSLGTNLSITGSVPATLNGAMVFSNFSTSINWSWTGMFVTRADGTVTNVANGNVLTVGLTPSSTYYFYPYYDEVLETIVFVDGGVGSSPDGAIAFTAQNITAAQFQNLSNRVPLSGGSMMATTPASGSGGGGSGGGSGGCLESSMHVNSRACGMVAIGNVEQGDELMGPDGWTRVTDIKILPQEIFIRVELETGDVVEVTPEHPFQAMDQNGNKCDVRAKSMTVTHLLFTKTGAAAVRSVSVVEKIKGRKAVVSCSPSRLFFSGAGVPNVVTHNVRPIT